MTFRRDQYATRTHADTMELLRALYKGDENDQALQYAIDAMNDAQGEQDEDCSDLG